MNMLAWQFDIGISISYMACYNDARLNNKSYIYNLTSLWLISNYNPQKQMKIITIIFFILSSWHLLNFLFSRSLKSENKKNIFFYLGWARDNPGPTFSSAGPGPAWRSMGCQARQALLPLLGPRPLPGQGQWPGLWPLPGQGLWPGLWPLPGQGLWPVPGQGLRPALWPLPRGRGPCLGKASGRACGSCLGRACRPARVSGNPSAY